MATTLDELVLKLTADTDELRQELRRGQRAVSQSSTRMRRSLESLQSSTRRIARTFLALAGLTGGVVAFNRLSEAINSATRSLDQFQKIAIRTGTSTDFIQESAFAAQQSSIGFRNFELSLQRFTRRAGEAAQGTGEALGAFKALNIELRTTDGRLRSVEDLFTEAIDKLAAVEDETTRLAIGFKFFDSEGARLVQAAERFAALRDEARDAGIAVRREVIDAAVEARDELTKLGSVLRSRLARSFTEALQQATAFAQKLFDIADAIDKVTTKTGLFTETVGEGLLVRRAGLLESLASLEERIANIQEARRTGQIGKLPGPFGAFDIKAQNAILGDLVEARRLTLEELNEVDRQLIELTRPEPGRARPDPSQFRPELLNRGAKSTAEEMDEAREAADELLDSFTAMTIGVDRWRRDSTEATDEWVKALQETKTEFEGITDFMVGGFSNAIASMVLTGKAGFKELGFAFLHEFLRRAISGLATSGISRLFGLFGAASTPTDVPSTGLFDDITFEGGVNRFPARAQGGRVSAGRLYRVNERGVELFQPDSSGRIIPASRRDGGLTVVVNNTMADEAEVDVKEQPDRRGLEITLSRTSANDVRRGGALSSSIATTFGASRRGFRGV